MRKVLGEALAGQDGFVELRWAAKTSRGFLVEKGKVEQATVKRRAGVGVRVLEDGTWGFSSTGSRELVDLRAAIERARAAARASAARRRSKVPELGSARLARGDLENQDAARVAAIPIEEKLELARAAEAETRAASTSIRSAACGYNEIDEEKAIVTSDGADVSFRILRPEFRVQAVAEKAGRLAAANESVGVTGDWDCLFSGDRRGRMIQDAARYAVELLDAGSPQGGRSTVILAPSIVGLLVHEAIGHTVEADFVQSGSVARGRLRSRVGSDLVTLCDSGFSEHLAGAGGSLPVDDEGVLTEKTVIIRNGILESYLHNRESAAAFGVAPTGNARAWDFSDQPLIRMRNTFLEPGDQDLAEMIAGVEEGYLLDGPKNGQADATGEFMFAVQNAWRIRHGKLAELVRGVTISGVAFQVMQTVDAVSREFRWDLGSGYCGKGQPAKVDAGGPYVRCEVLLGGTQD
ncbi:MAG: TldD/PmbA family protein [Planctomycetes bacterium]|nr:TldD/PmbA family protein [Planctomycetota bacterium]